MKHDFYDVFNKRGYTLGHIMVTIFQDPMEVAKKEYGKNVLNPHQFKKEKKQPTWIYKECLGCEGSFKVKLKSLS